MINCKELVISLLGVTAATALVYAAGTAPVIITQPQSQTVNEGESVTFSVIAESNTGFPEGENFTTPISSTVNLDMIWIEPGTFMMGSPGNSSVEAQHQVTLTKGYWLGKYEVTQKQYKAVMGTNPSWYTNDNEPVEMVTWNDATNFCAKLTEIEKAAGRLPAGYRYTLPTEAQWEYACRAGTTTDLNSGKNLSNKDQCPEMDEVGWYNGNSASPHSVGQKQPNAWGLYDMHGNVQEWCLDWYRDYPTSSVTDPTGPATGLSRVMRGGTCVYYASKCRSASRNRNTPDSSFEDSGFRVALCRTTEDILTYQWYKNGTAISGATGSSYTIGSVKASDAGSYTVTVTDWNGGSVTSDAAVLTVKEKMSVQREVSVTGNKATVTLTISNAPKGYIAALEENWQSKILTFSGISNGGTAAETENGMKVSWSGFDMSGNYQFPGTLTYTATVPEGTSATVALSGQLMITTSNGAVSADIAVQNVTFTVAPSAPVITAQPKSQTVSEGGSVTFSVTATGSAPLLYQWMKDGAVISGATGSSYTIGSVKAGDAGAYMVMIMNAQGAVMSSPATLTLAQEGAPELKLEPAGSGKWKITFTGTLQESTDMKTWKNVSGTQGGTYTFSPAFGKKFFRAAK